MFDLDLDPFFDDDFGFPRMDDQLDFVNHSSSNNSAQVLDDLFAMLQTRQRPQIPLQPMQQPNASPQNAEESAYYMMDHVMAGQPSS
ncbi:hypothetical protein BCR42DRAFT_408216 [Absidia repens]|uniref:Uncharacterized protein n=1 Tax=Absidia repens TaxID=90262 RepID=A0A1X2IPL0_9FUNG|nr:hypothetical protein BCR42DRAFT_408216 [Absidia repens]